MRIGERLVRNGCVGVDNRQAGARPAQGTATTTDATIRMMYGTACFTQEFFEMLIQFFVPFRDTVIAVTPIYKV